MIEQFHLLRPWWLLLLIPLAGVIWLLLKNRYDAGSWRAVIDARLLPFVLSAGSQNSRGWSRWVFGSVASLAILALAGPTWEKLPQSVYHKETALVIALDLSRSMNSTDLKPSRLTRARHKIADILNLRQEGQTALVVYAADAFTVTPLTSDVDTILALLPDLDTALMPAQGTRADRAVKLALELFTNSGITRGDVLLVSDGLRDHEVERVETLLAEKPGQRLSVLAVGTRVGGPVPLKNGGVLKDGDGAIVITGMLEGNLQRIAQSGGGVFTAISADESDIRFLTDMMNSSIDEREARLSDRSTDTWRELGPWLLLFVLPLAALGFRRGLIWLVPLYIVVLPPDAQAIDWQSMWQNNDQRASELFEHEEHAAAAALFDNPGWQAASKYRAGDYSTALDAWQQLDGDDANYNRANTLAKLGRYEDALAAYQQLLEQNPAHEDARFNKKALEEWLENQQQQQGEQAQQQQQSASDDTQSSDSQQSSEKQQNQTDGSDQAQQQEPQSTQQEQKQQPQQTEQSAEQEQPETSAEALAELDQKMTEQAAEQWLRKIPDDPGGLLRRKFVYQYRQRGGVDAEAQSW